MRFVDKSGEVQCHPFIISVLMGCHAVHKMSIGLMLLAVGKARRRGRYRCPPRTMPIPRQQTPLTLNGIGSGAPGYAQRQRKWPGSMCDVRSAATDPCSSAFAEWNQSPPPIDDHVRTNKNGRLASTFWSERGAQAGGILSWLIELVSAMPSELDRSFSPPWETRSPPSPPKNEARTSAARTDKP